MLSRRLINIAALFISAGSVSAQTPHQTIVTKTEREVIPEGITINPADGKIYVSSIALKKIISIDSTGAHRDFIKTGQDGFQEGLGMKIDQKKQWLWVVSNPKKGKGTSHVHAFDLKTGAVRQHYEVKDTSVHLLNDLILHPNGKVYITDTYASCLYEVDPARKKLKILIKDNILDGANGIAFNEKGKVYIATRNGLLHWNVASNQLIPLTFSDSRKSLWLDGLVYWNNRIMGVGDNVIVQYLLNDKGDQIMSEKIIDEKNKLFHEPTTIALFKEKLYAIANSNLAVYNNNDESVSGIEDQLGPVMILVYPLEK
ncbi:MAG TPA: SMP-30/gluconolactonase/LRE family protein [Cyclobacteriaceae bacterium]|nr:SMP-30/gluconolactonase/LRE family protein [Cyclobacteriaceae bacterium]